MNTICFGQQPCGFFPKRFLIAKINTVRRLQAEIGGSIVFFYHDSDADYRETITLMKDRMTGAEVRLNFIQENKLQKKHSPLYLKRIPAGWKNEILKQLSRFMDRTMIDLFLSINAGTVADFCLKMYQNLRVPIRANSTMEENRLLDGIEIVRSSNPDFRQRAIDIQKGFADVQYKGEIVRAKIVNTQSNNFPRQSASKSASVRGLLHEGGKVYTYLPKPAKISKAQISAGADERFKWMQSVIHCTHYIYGEGEKEYLKFNDFPDVKFIRRDEIKEPEHAWFPS